jgi:hypothetical protein
MLERTAVILSLAALILCASCQEDTASTAEQSRYSEYVSEIVYASDLLTESSNGAAVIDLRLDEVGYIVEHGVDLSQFTLLCPNGQIMSFETWVAEQSSAFGIEYAERPEGFFIMKALDSPARQSAKNESYLRAPPSCPPDCGSCPDGACFC